MNLYACQYCLRICVIGENLETATYHMPLRAMIKLEDEYFWSHRILSVIKNLQIFVTRDQYRRDAQKAYQEKMLAAHTGKAEYPKIRTFNKSQSSTNSVYKDLEAAERLWVP